MSALGNVVRKIAWAVRSELPTINKGSNTSPTAAFAGSFGQGFLSSSSVTPAYSPREAAMQFRSWVYNCASRNAVMIGNAHLRLYAARGTGELPPQYAKYRRMPHVEQVHLMSRVHKAIDPNIAQRWANGEVMEILEHPFLDLMMQVNPFRDQFDHMEETSIFSDCHGNAYWYIVTGKGLRAGIPTELWLLPSQNVAIIPDKQTFIKGYLFGGQSQHVALSQEEVIHFRRPNPADQYYGRGRIEAAFTEITGMNAIAELEADRARTRGVHDLHFQIKGGDLTEAQRNDYAYQFQNLFALNRRNPVPLLTGGEVDVTNIAWAPKELLTSGSREFNRQCVINAFGQSTALWSESSVRANVEAGIYQWCRFEIDPSLVRYAQKINQQLIPMYESGDRLFCAWDQQAKEDRDFQMRQEIADRSANLRTINEIRKSRDLDPDPDPRADDLFAGAVSGQEALDAQMQMLEGGGGPGREPPAAREPAGSQGAPEA